MDVNYIPPTRVCTPGPRAQLHGRDVVWCWKCYSWQPVDHAFVAAAAA
jgi:hypothetical protein